mmetsp:Transcript_20238/g.26352  ORF Transcript_20238/g.26352 Transcript_20238/m.26352 type:complete len:171 (-) Transcript_20238:370-882(-)
MEETSFEVTVLCGVRFVELSPSSSDSSPTILHLPKLPRTQWSPQTHAVFPQSFKKSSFAVLTAANHQNLKYCGINKLPNSLWLEVLSFTSRGWFENAPSESETLRLKLSVQIKKRKKAEQEAEEANSARREAERECARWKGIAMRLERQLRSVERQQEAVFNTRHPPLTQ